MHKIYIYSEFPDSPIYVIRAPYLQDDIYIDITDTETLISCMNGAAPYGVERHAEDWKQLEHIFMRDPYLACIYAVNVKQSRWLEGESVILEDWRTFEDYFYQIIVKQAIECPECEHLIAEFPQMSAQYAMRVLCRRWPPGEPAIMRSATDACEYARNVLKRRWPEAEPIILTDDNATWHYAVYVIRGRWPEAETQDFITSAWWESYAIFTNIS